MNAMHVTLDDVSFFFDHHRILNHLSLYFARREILALVGASGSGKTTLLKLLSGILTPCSGNITIFGKSPNQSRLSVTLMQQDDALLPWRDVIGNITLFSELGEKQELDMKKVYELLNTLGLKDKAHTFPSELSKGMRQRVALARVFLEDRPLILLDEPFTSLDVLLREHLYSLIHQLHSINDKTILFVTHDFHDAFSLAHRIIILKEGAIVQEYTIDPSMKHDPFYIQTLKEQIRLTLGSHH